MSIPTYSDYMRATEIVHVSWPKVLDAGLPRFNADLARGRWQPYAYNPSEDDVVWFLWPDEMPIFQPFPPPKRYDWVRNPMTYSLSYSEAKP